MALHLDYGKKSEEQALAWLSDRYPIKLVEKNYRCKMGELDLVLQEGDELVFVEVRARQVSASVCGLESIGPRKLQRIRKSIRHFLARYDGDAQSVRFDVMAWDGVVWTYVRGIWI